MAVNFPQNPSEGDTFTSGNSTFVFTNGKWVSASSPNSLVSKSGDTMTGLLTLSGDPVSDDQAASKSYVDTAVESAGAVLVGQIVMWGSSTIPSGWLECNGQSTASYPVLAALYGSNVPDLRGEFVRGFDSGRGVDTGRALLSTQGDQFALPNTAFGTSNPGNHTHSVRTEKTDGGQSGSTGEITHKNSSTGGGGSHTHTINGGDDETRPRNVALMYIIKT